MEKKLSDEEYKKIKTQYENETFAVKKSLTASARDLINGISSRRNELKYEEELRSALVSHKIEKPSEFFTGEYKCIADSYIPEQFRRAFLYSIDSMNKWQYSTSYYRRTVRTEDYTVQVSEVFKMINDCVEAGVYKCSIEDIVSSDMPENMLLYSVRSSSYFTEFRLTNIIAAELDLGNDKLEKALTDIILGDNNTSALTTGMIRGIVRSHNTKLHKLLGDYLLAARLQEGVRQAVCENMDCGTAEAFITLLDVIRKNDLIRYSSVKRASATWTGIFDYENVERISNKVLDLVYDSLTDEKLREENLTSDDSIELYCALWAYGFYNVREAVRHLNDIMQSGIRNRILVCSYYLKNIEWSYVQRKTALYAVENYADDHEILACFMPCYMDGYTESINKAVYRVENGLRKENYKDRPHCALDGIFENREQARKHYTILLKILNGLKHKQEEFSPCIFPWYAVNLTKTQIISRLCYIASALDDNEKCDEICTYIPEIDISNYGSRRMYILCLLTDPQTPVQRKMLVKMLSDREQYSRDTAFELIKNITLVPDEYLCIEKMLKYKSADIRTQVSELLYKQDDDGLAGCIERLASGKSEELRTGALDLMLTLSKDEKRENCYKKCSSYTSLIKDPTTKEKILIDEICSDKSAGDVLNVKGYGLYDPDENYTPSKPDLTDDIEKYHEVFPAAAAGKIKSGNLKDKISAVFSHTDTKLPDYYQCLVKLDNYIEEHKDAEFTGQYSGDAEILGACQNLRRYSDNTLEGSIYLADLWRDFYNKEKMTFPLLVRMLVFLYAKTELSQLDFWDEQFRFLFGNDFFTYETKFRYKRHLITITNALYNEYKDKKLMLSITKVIYSYTASEVPVCKQTLSYKNDYGYTYETSLLGSAVYRIFAGEISFDYALKSECGKDVFDILTSLTQRFGLYKKKDYHLRSIILSFSDYIIACTAGIISKNYLYKVFFELLGPGDCLSEISLQYKKEDTDYPEKFKKIRDEVFTKTTDLILGIELRRGDSQTPVSRFIYDIKRVYGVEKLASVLSALGKETLNRSQYFNVYYNSSKERVVSKKDSLSHLLSVCAPSENDTAQKLRELICKTDITQQRLIETAMYNSLWMDIVGEYLGWEGFKSACYYFIAHMNERFDNTTEAIIAKYTPLTPEQLNGGAFDIRWFRQAYSELGEKRFDAVYKAAKYISDGSKHTRARKYADAVCSKLDAGATREEIIRKRNKDTLMAYSLIPLRDDDELSERYEFIQQFLKESKQFGAQRRASEAAACQTALENLSANAGFADVTRLTMRMESRIVQKRASQFEPVEIDDVSVRINIDENGKPEIECLKNGKKLKSVPAKLKKNEYIAVLKETLGILKNQYSRTKLMLEQSMEDRVFFTVGEISELSTNPVIRPLTKDLIYLHNDIPGFLRENSLVDYDGKATALNVSDEIAVAHPLDLYKNGHWHEYQEYAFKNKIKQPFKQIFRELYVKTEEELGLNRSLRYAGNQIQPKKTVGCLKSRRWIADYENGLQKIYYKENIIASIYAMADWFSPSEIEAPTLEYVQFFDRKTFKPITIENVPDIIFSEVMRDVDLAVSVAHAGTVDPETSHSTVEMRKVIAQFTLDMFKLSNVTFEKSHAIIEGKKGRYSVHLGSGVIHQYGGTQINVLPVHSQHRGKIFLPFIDEDPKTAEIMSKILLFAEDTKIKDPYILSQIS